MAAALALWLPAAPLPAQSAPEIVGSEVFAGSGLESYLRTLQVAGLLPHHPWAVRGFSARELRWAWPVDSVGPWAGRYALSRDSASGLEVDLVAPESRTVYNSAYPFGGNDGPVWAGRGITTSVRAGAAIRYGGLSLTVAPILFYAENRSFELQAGLNRDGYSPFGDPADPGGIDLPQRFGDGAYARLDPGESTLRVDLPPVTLGVSTASQYWGPASAHPMVLGNNAGGFAHLFAGTATPWNVGIGRVHGRMVWGRLEQTKFSPMPDSMALRFMTGAVATFLPRGIAGLEVGASRFFHNVWPRDGLRPSDFAQPLESLLKIGLPTQGSQPDTANDEVRRSSPDNQLASVFARWVFPRSGVEVYGEFAREDHNYDLRDLILEPTHNSGYMLGFQRVWRRSDERLLGLRGEVMNAQPGHTSLARDVAQSPFYRHASTRQGHTQRGQILGSAAGYGGAASVIGVDGYHPGGRWTVEWSRAVVGERGRSLDDKVRYGDKAIDVLHSLGLEALLFTSRLELTAGVTGAYEINRHYKGDAFNLHAALRVRARL